MSIDECTCFFMLGSASRKVLAVHSYRSFLNGVYNTTDRRKWLRFGDIMMKLIRDIEVVLREKDFKKDNSRFRNSIRTAIQNKTEHKAKEWNRLQDIQDDVKLRNHSDMTGWSCLVRRLATDAAVF